MEGTLDLLQGALSLIEQLLIGLGFLIAAIAGAYWIELSKLRAVRHADRDDLSEIKAENTIFRMDFDDYKKDQMQQHIDLKQQIDRLQWILEELGKTNVKD